MKLALSLITVIVCFSVFMLLWRFKIRQQKVIKNRMEYFSSSAVRQRQQQLRQGKVKGQNAQLRFRGIIHSLALKVQEIQKNNRMDFKMQQADWPLMGSEFEVILGLVGLICALIAMLTTLNITIALAAGVVGIVLGLMFLDIYIKRRQKAFTNQLGDMLQMVSNALRAGFSFLQAFELIAREMDAPIGREVQKVVNEINVGATLETALDNMQRRVQSNDFQLVVTAVLIQRQVGGNLAQILDSISDTIAERIRMRREVLALTAQGRMSGIVLAALPFGVAVILSIINPDYLKPLYTEPLGKMAIAGAAIMEIIGFIVISKIVNIKV